MVRRFDQLSASLRARLTPTGELRPAAGGLTRVVERAPAGANAAGPSNPDPAPVIAQGAIDLAAGDTLSTTV